MPHWIYKKFKNYIQEAGSYSKHIFKITSLPIIGIPAAIIEETRETGTARRNPTDEGKSGVYIWRPTSEGMDTGHRLTPKKALISQKYPTNIDKLLSFFQCSLLFHSPPTPTHTNTPYTKNSHPFHFHS